MATLTIEEVAEYAHEVEAEHGGYWGEHPDYPVSDWQDEVAADHTRCGYWEWVAHNLNEQ